MSYATKPWLVVTALCATTMGCFKTAELSLRDSADSVAELRAESTAPTLAKRPDGVRIALAAQAKLGCVITETSDDREADDLGSIRCDAFQLPASATTSAVEAKADSLSDHAGHGFLMDGFDATALDVVRYRVAQRFAAPQIRLVGAPAERANDEVVVELQGLVYYGGAMQTSGRSMKVSLVATYPDGSQLRADGLGRVESANGQLGWMIPFSILFFPIGLLPSSIVAGNIHSDHVRMAVWNGLDDAAGKLALAMAERGAPAAAPP